MKEQQKELRIPPTLSLFINVFTAASKREARIMFYAAIEALYPKRTGVKFKRNDLKIAFSLMRDMKPKIDLEKVLCAQFIVGHLIGMQKLSQGYFKDKRIRG